MSQEIIDEKVLELIDRSLLEHPDIGYVSLEGRIRLRKELFNAVRRRKPEKEYCLTDE